MPLKKYTYNELVDRIGELEQKVEKLKNVENVLKVREGTLRALLNAPTETAILVDLEGTILAANEVAAQRIGKPAEELVGLGIFNYLPYSVAISRMAMAQKVINSGKPLRFQDERAGRFYDNNIYPVFNEDGNIKALAIFAKDVTETRQAEEALVLERDRLQAALAKIKKLSGMLPICASCKKIRDDKGYWNQIESYIHEHSDAQFSHGICPQCADELYSDFVFGKKIKDLN
ncbi:putative PAS/PAC sensor protein [Olavius algarvensis Delta 1 endosymbiont]|nr:putative PAS/PAC sensor protein [Olavius algarvensis Delta 1 endosymbiont]